MSEEARIYFPFRRNIPQNAWVSANASTYSGEGVIYFFHFQEYSVKRVGMYQVPNGCCTAATFDSGIVEYPLRRQVD
jgi:hypothetical protein